MKILVISNYYPPFYVGGYELSCFNTVEYLKKAGHEIEVLTSDYLKEEKEEKGIYREYKFIDYKNPSYMNKYMVENINYEITKKHIKRFNPDIVYFWSLRLISMSPVWLVDELGLKRVFEIGDFWMSSYIKDNSSSKIKRKIKNLIPFSKARDVDINPVICVSKWMEQELRDKYGSKDVHTIPNGIDVVNTKRFLDKKRMKFIFTGRVDELKGVDLAIRAFSILKDIRLDTFEFNIYGDGDESYIKRCKKLVQVLGLEKNIFFHGKRDNLDKEYQSHHVLLMPTRLREAFGLVIIEAMTNGVVVIASDAYGPAEIITHNKTGLLFKPNSVNDLAKNIISVYKKWEKMEELKNNAYDLVLNKYNLPVVKKDIENILLKIKAE